MDFWLAAGGMGVAAMLVIAFPLFQRRARHTLEKAKLTAAYRDQLERLTEDHRNGQITDEEAATGRAEIGRRLLAAEDQAPAEDGHAPMRATLVSLGAVILALMVAIGIYLQTGAPDLPDQPLASRDLLPDRPSQVEMVARVADRVAEAARQPSEQEQVMLGQLEEILAERTDDPLGFQHLANLQRSLGNFNAAAKAQARVVELKGDTAGAEEVAALGEMMILAADGYVSQEADQVLVRALRLDPTHVMARYYSGVSLAQNGKADIALRMWTRLWAESPPDAPWRESIRSQIIALAEMAGLPAPPIVLAGSNPLDTMDADQAEAVTGMVAGLAERLASEGGPPEDWARLIRSLTVLGETDRAAAIMSEAETVFFGDEAALEMIRAAPMTVQPQ